MPIPISKLPLNKVGYPVPWFVARPHETGTEDYDFRVIRGRGIEYALVKSVCWVCGEPLSGMQAFVIGPMCAINHTSAEPPSHLTCARWAAIACPFLARPNMVRRERFNFEHVAPAGMMIARNPGVALVWKVRAGDWHVFSDGAGGMLFDIGQTRGAEWYAHGREATRAEVMESIDSGFPILLEQAAQEDDAEAATADLKDLYDAALELVPT
jgi:hypothetical protein